MKCSWFQRSFWFQYYRSILANNGYAKQDYKWSHHGSSVIVMGNLIQVAVPPIPLHIVTIQETVTWVFISMKTSRLTTKITWSVMSWSVIHVCRLKYSENQLLQGLIFVITFLYQWNTCRSSSTYFSSLHEAYYCVYGLASCHSTIC